MNLISRKMAARAGVRQLDALHAANGIANRVDARIGILWRKLLRILKAEEKRRKLSMSLAIPHEVTRQIAGLVAQMHQAARDTLHRDFVKLAKWGHQSAADVLLHTLPVRAMKGVASGQKAMWITRNVGGFRQSSQQLRSDVDTHSRTIEMRLTNHVRGLSDQHACQLYSSNQVISSLTFPDIRQSADWDCGAAAILSVAKFFDVGPSSEREFIRIARTDPQRGTRVTDLIRAAQAVGLTVRKLRGPRQLAAFARAGWPVICPVQSGPRQERENEDAGHYVIVLRTGKRFVRVQDPLAGRRWIRWADFLRDWHDRDDDGMRYEQFGLAFMRRDNGGYPADLLENPRNNRATTKAIDSLEGKRVTDYGLRFAQRTRNEKDAIPLLEDEPLDPGPIILKLGLGGELQATDRLGRLREPVRPELSDDQQRKLLGQLLFPPLPLQRILDILRHPVAGSNWEQDLSASTRLADPSLIMGIVAGGFAAGKTPREVETLLRPAVAGVKSTARRIARTYGMQIAHRAQMDAHAAVDDLIVGYQVHALLDQHTRPWHAARNGEVYYKRPEQGQKGFAQMPHPPAEAEDPSERPAGTPRVAPN